MALLGFTWQNMTEFGLACLNFDKLGLTWLCLPKLVENWLNFAKLGRLYFLLSVSVRF